MNNSYLVLRYPRPNFVCNLGTLVGKEVGFPLPRNPGDMRLAFHKMAGLFHPRYCPRNIRSSNGYRICDAHLGKCEWDFDFIGMIYIVT